jgi:lauroyl/myristoyl acyltransferase
MMPIAWLVPQRWWSPLGQAAIALVSLLIPGKFAERRRHISACAAGRQLPAATAAIVRRWFSRFFEDNLLLLRCYRPDRWEPTVELRGLEHIRAASAAGRGAVLWFSHFHHFSLVSKIALYRAGIAMSHLSHPRHGFSGTRFGMRYLNRVRTRIEDRYLGERIYLALDNSAVAMETLYERLLGGAVASVAARGTSRRPAIVPFLAGRLPLATGAADLAYRAGSFLLPVHTVQVTSGAFAVIIEPPIALDASRNLWTAVEAAARDFAARMEPMALAYPDQWEDWALVEAGGGPER